MASKTTTSLSMRMPLETIKKIKETAKKNNAHASTFLSDIIQKALEKLKPDILEELRNILSEEEVFRWRLAFAKKFGWGEQKKMQAAPKAYKKKEDKEEMASTTTSLLSVRIPNATLAELKRKAAEAGKPLSTFCAELIEQNLNGEEQPVG